MTNEIININLIRKIGWIKVKQVMNQVYLIPEQTLITCEFEDLVQLCEDVSAMLHCAVNKCYVPTLEEIKHLPKNIRKCDNCYWTSTMSPLSNNYVYCVNTDGDIYDGYALFSYDLRPIIVIDYEEYKTLMEVK